MPTVSFDRLEDANAVRERVEKYLSARDDRRKTDVVLQGATPEEIVERVEQEAQSSRRRQREGAGMQELTKQERESLKRQHRTFQWQNHGFEAMRVKAALRRAGVAGREWMDYYEPGEGPASARAKLREAKQRAERGGGTTAVERGRRTDEEQQGGRGRRARQAERASAKQVKRAKSPAFRGDDEAIAFLEREQLFRDDLFDIAFSDTDRFGRPAPSGSDFQELQEANEERGRASVVADDLQHAEVTRDPLEWAEDPTHHDFPGVDTLDPEKVHAARSERAQAADEEELAPLADTVAGWAVNMDETDLPGIDTPTEDASPTESSIGSPADLPADPLSPERREREANLGRLAAMDISLAPEEAFEGTGAVGITALGGFNPTDEREEDRPEAGAAGKLPASAPSRYAAGPEADTAFVRAEEQRRRGGR